jgi:hypothetical protein
MYDQFLELGKFESHALTASDDLDDALTQCQKGLSRPSLLVNPDL